MATDELKPPPLLDVEHLRSRAAEVRAIAEKFKDARVKKEMLDIADTYDRLADRDEWYRARYTKTEK